VFFDQLAGQVPRPARGVAMKARPMVQRQVRAFLTRRLMRMRLPDVTLDLGGDVPPFSEKSRFPPGLETLELRFARQCENALAIAQRLAVHKATVSVRYPGLGNDPSHALARKQMRR
jgi:O-acetylhomoserine/O-acetylserine sulfhydrylase-like pyridoxal-dependent enzyme